MKIVKEIASAGFSLEVKPGSWVKSDRGIEFEYLEGSRPSDEEIRSILLGKLKGDFIYYSKGIVGEDIKV